MFTIPTAFENAPYDKWADYNRVALWMVLEKRAGLLLQTKMLTLNQQVFELNEPAVDLADCMSIVSI